MPVVREALTRSARYGANMLGNALISHGGRWSRSHRLVPAVAMILQTSVTPTGANRARGGGCCCGCVNAAFVGWKPARIRSILFTKYALKSDASRNESWYEGNFGSMCKLYGHEDIFKYRRTIACVRYTIMKTFLKSNRIYLCE